MRPRTKLLAAVSFTVALIALLFLATGLSGLPLEAGSPLPGAAGSQAAPAPRSVPTSVAGSALPLLEVLLAAALLVLLVSIPVRLIKLASLRRIFWLLLALSALIGLALVLPRIPAGPPPAPPADLLVPATAAPAQYPAPPLGAPPSLLFWLAAMGLLAGIVTLLVLLWRRIAQPPRASQALSEQASRALRDLADGADFPNTIIRCYLQMMSLLRRERNMERESSMTAHEFQGWLESNGIPAAPLSSLTALFEKARYSREQINAEDERLGIQSLNQIVQYCGKGASVS